MHILNIITKHIKSTAHATNGLIEVVDPIPLTTGSEVVAFILNIIIGLGWSLVFIFISLGFINYITSKGEKEKLQNAQQTITYAIIGGIILLLLSNYNSIINQLLGENAINENIERYAPEVEEEVNYSEPRDPYCERYPNAAGCENYDTGTPLDDADGDPIRPID